VLPFHGGASGEDGKDRGVGVIVGNGPNGIVKVEVVLERRVIAFPSNYIEGRIIALIFKDLSNVFVHDCPFFLLILEPSSRSLEVCRIGETVGSDWPQLRQLEMMTEDLRHPALDFLLNVDGKFNASGNYQNLSGLDHQETIEGFDV
jgi:hypothetical protein